jgi:lysophospholipase L1-like esterase
MTWTKLTQAQVQTPASTIKDFYKNSKNGKKIVFVGDSTTDPNTADLYTHLTNYYLGSGQLLEGAIYETVALSGSMVKDFIANTGVVKLSDAITKQGDLYIISYGINDITQNRTDTQIRADLKTAIDSILSQTSGYILLRTPNTFQNTNGNWLTVPQPQEFSSRLWEIYQTFYAYNSRVDVIDMQSLVFGRKAVDTHPLMSNQIHPSSTGYWAIVDEIVERICGIDTNPYNTFYDYDVVMKGYVFHTTDVTNTSFTFSTNSTKTLQVDDVIILGNSYSFVVSNTPTYNAGLLTWTITHSHTGSFNKYGTVKVLRKKS